MSFPLFHGMCNVEDYTFDNHKFDCIVAYGLQ